MENHFLSVRIVRNQISLKLGRRDTIDFPINGGSRIQACIFRYSENDGIEVCSMNNTECIYDLTGQSFHDRNFNNIFNLPSVMETNNTAYDYFGVICLAGRWKFPIRDAGFNNINKKFCLGLNFPIRQEDEANSTNVIGLWGSDSSERFSSVKINRKISFRSDVRNFDSFFSQRNFKGDNFQVGDVVFSILSPSQFRHYHGNSWKIMDGTFQLANNSDLRTNRTHVPDSRGRFIRCMNYNGGVNPDGDNIGVCSSQDDKTRISNFSITNSGVHNHQCVGNGTHNHNLQQSGKHTHTVNASTNDNPKRHWRMKMTDSVDTMNRAVINGAGEHTHTCDNSGNHQHNIQNNGGHVHDIQGGDNETAPKYMTFFCYMKVC